ncbi:MAG: phosphoribosylformylglycinamidine synthase I [Candidatus Stahlbacteria bacterium]|nr:phosphoribosylformylglycinamidine synthase I [Candidatus Stahlbacteria bacterium]
MQMIEKKVQVLILRTAGTNCDMETKAAFEMVGAEVDLLHINQLIADKKILHQYDILVLPGGFTYGDDISAGKILANEIKYRIAEEVNKFVENKKLVLGICNGFQILVKFGLLPKGKISKQVVTLTNNISGVFQCEWINLTVENSPCVFTQGITELFLPIAHAEGRFIAPKSIITELISKRQVALTYKGYNPNGSISGIAGICDPTGRIFGLMPHPERFIFATQHPNWNKLKYHTKHDPDGLNIFKNAVKYIIDNCYH